MITEERIGDHQIISKTLIRHPSGIEIVQLVVKWDIASHKVIWVRDDTHVMEIDGKPNAMAHADFRPDHLINLEAAIKRVKEAFCEYWEISQEF